jgi:hypothetical protein
MSNVRRSLSTPPVATTEWLYLFQSWVRTSAGPAGGAGGLEEDRGLGVGGVWTGITVVRWYRAEDGVRRSNMRMFESEETAETRDGLEGQKEVL